MGILIDTDPGIDDAIALLYALRQPVLDVLAITTVAGNIGLSVTTRNALRVCAMAQVFPPVHAGAAASLNGETRPEIAVHGSDGLGGVAFPEPAQSVAPTDAIEAFRAILDPAPAHSIDLFCLGPLTNLARLITEAPETARRLRRVIAMGGTLKETGNAGARAEFNIAHDPRAATIVFASGLDLTLIPLDTTRQFRADAAFIRKLRKSGAPAAMGTAALLDGYFATAHGRESRPLHDPCVPLFAQCPEAFHIETRSLAIEENTGALISGLHPVQVALGCDPVKLRGELLAGLCC